MGLKIVLSFITAFVIWLVGLPSHSAPKTAAVDPNPVSIGENSNFYLEPGLVEKIYQVNSAKDSVLRAQHLPSIDLRAGGFVLRQVEVSNRYFTVAYDRAAQIAANVEMGVSKVVFDERFSGSLRGHVGYSYQQGMFRVQPTDGQDAESYLTLQWIPIGVSFRLSPNGSDLKYPTLTLGSGGLGFFQSGTLDGINQTGWVPFYRVGLETKIGGSPSDLHSISNGLILSVGYLDSFSNGPIFRGWLIQLGTEFTM